jgi:hypothetical protein
MAHVAHALVNAYGIRPPKGFSEHDFIYQTMLAEHHPPLDLSHPPWVQWHDPYEDTGVPSDFETSPKASKPALDLRKPDTWRNLMTLLGVRW